MIFLKKQLNQMNKSQKKALTDIALVTLSFLISYVLSNAGVYILSGIVLILCGLYVGVSLMISERNILEPRGIFSLSWVSCIGISSLKLSFLQTEWEAITWICFYLIYVSFYLSFFLSGQKIKLPVRNDKGDCSPDSLFLVILILTLISLLSFTAEILILGYVPLFTVDTPHAYSYFHVSGLHYFTVLCVLEPAFFTVYLFNRKTDTVLKKTLLIFCTAVCLMMPVLMVSRFQLVFSVSLAVLSFLIMEKVKFASYMTRRNILIAAGGVALLIISYVFITFERAHSADYLAGIFEMKFPVPIAVSQPYIYISNNFDNFNCLVKELPAHSYGMKQLFPVFALTGLKFRVPELVNYPIYVTKEELTTVTMFYDAYYDFGVPGCVILSIILGILYSVLEKLLKERRDPCIILIGAQLYTYLILAFFTTWFSNPATWFYFGVCVVIQLILWYSKKTKMKRSGSHG